MSKIQESIVFQCVVWSARKLGLRVRNSSSISILQDNWQADHNYLNQNLTVIGTHLQPTQGPWQMLYSMESAKVCLCFLDSGLSDAALIGAAQYSSNFVWMESGVME